MERRCRYRLSFWILGGGVGVVAGGTAFVIGFMDYGNVTGVCEGVGARCGRGLRICLSVVRESLRSALWMRNGHALNLGCNCASSVYHCSNTTQYM